MANKKNKKPLISFKNDSEEFFKKINLGSNETIKISNEDIITEKQRQEIINNKNLALSFKIITENDDYNLSYFKSNSGDLKIFLKGMDQTFRKITSLKVKDLYNDPFKDRFLFSTLKQSVYRCSGKTFEGVEQVISVEFGSKRSPYRVILYQDPNQGNENVLYILMFQFSFNNSPYRH